MTLWAWTPKRRCAQRLQVVCLPKFSELFAVLRELEADESYIIVYLKDQKILVLRDRHDLFGMHQKTNHNKFLKLPGSGKKKVQPKKENFGPRSCYMLHICWFTLYTEFPGSCLIWRCTGAQMEGLSHEPPWDCRGATLERPRSKEWWGKQRYKPLAFLPNGF